MFKDIAVDTYEAFTSRYVVNELSDTKGEKREKMLGLILQYDIPILEPTDEAVAIANHYVKDGIMPQKYRTDGLHIALATVYNLDMIISMNFQHIVKRKTKIGTAHINALHGYRSVDICTPMEVVEDEN